MIEKAEEEAEKVYREADSGTDVLSSETMAEYLTHWIEAKKGEEPRAVVLASEFWAY